MNFFKLCRGCMKELATCELEKFDERTYEMFIFCTKIQVNIEDKLPSNFCSDCRNQIKASYKFIKHSLEINNTLHNIFSENGIYSEHLYHQKVETTFNFDEKLDVRGSPSYYENCMNNVDDVRSNYVAQDIKLEEDIDSQIQPRQIIQRLKNSEGKVGKCKDLKYVKDAEETTVDNQFDVDKTLKQENIYLLELEESKVKTETNLEKPFHGSEEKTPTRNLRKRKKNYEYLDDLQPTQEDGNICPICNKSYSLGNKGQLWLKKHMKQHSKQKERQLTKKEKKLGLCISKTESTTDEKGIKTCPKCKKSFTNQIWFTKHMTKHATTEVHACPYCTKTFTTYAQLVYHKQSHEQDKKHVCNVCDKRFRLQKQLAVHAMTHSDERPYICDKCYMAFKMKHVLINHLRVHANSKPFLCSTCGQGFTTAHSLEHHGAVHTRARPYACSQCGFRTGYPSVLRQHIKRHSQNKRHKCSLCDKTFYESGSLKRHIRIHTGERPFKCPTCPLAFIDAWKRKVHIMRVHQLSLEEIPRLTREGRPATAVIR